MLEERDAPLVDVGSVSLSARPASVEYAKPHGPGVAITPAAPCRAESQKEGHWACYSSPKSIGMALEEETGRLRALAHERLVFLLLDRGERAVASLTFLGGETHVAPDLKRLMGLALGLEAAGLVMIHNHPSGDPSPSSQDIAITRRISNMTRTMGMALFDHIIVAAAAVFSFRKTGLI